MGKNKNTPPPPISFEENPMAKNEIFKINPLIYFLKLFMFASEFFYTFL